MVKNVFKNIFKIVEMLALWPLFLIIAFLIFYSLTLKDTTGEHGSVLSSFKDFSSNWIGWLAFIKINIKFRNVVEYQK